MVFPSQNNTLQISILYKTMPTEINEIWTVLTLVMLPQPFPCLLTISYFWVMFPWTSSRKTFPKWVPRARNWKPQRRHKLYYTWDRWTFVRNLNFNLLYWSISVLSWGCLRECVCVWLQLVPSGAKKCEIAGGQKSLFIRACQCEMAFFFSKYQNAST